VHVSSTNSSKAENVVVISGVFRSLVVVEAPPADGVFVGLLSLFIEPVAVFTRLSTAADADSNIRSNVIVCTSETGWPLCVGESAELAVSDFVV
jgi:hypothetical protein